jgi:HEAT repeat protein
MSREIQVDRIVEAMEADPCRVVDNYEYWRGSLLALGDEALPAILERALGESDPHTLEMLVIVLVDAMYPPALPHMVEWLDHPDKLIRFDAASALDILASGRFHVQELRGPTGEPAWSQIDALIPDIKGWWRARCEAG